MKGKNVFSLLIAVVMAFSSFSVCAENNVNDQEQHVIEYSNNMIKSIIRAYAHDIVENYYYGIDDKELLFAVICSGIDEGKIDVNKAIEAMIRKLDDKYADYYTKEEYEQMVSDVKGEFSGIGVVISQNDDGAVRVISVVDDSPASKAGIISGDIIVKVDETSVKGLDISQVKKLIVGEKKTQVKIGILRGKNGIDVVCERDTVEVSNIETAMLTDDIAYLRLVQFSQNAPDEIEKYLKEIQQNNIKKLVFDLRDNPGGDLDSAIKIANLFISAGRIGQIRYKDESKNTYIHSSNFNAPRLKIVLLVNENSASASELLSMAFQDRGAAKLIGNKTYGKGSMQILQRAVTGAGMKYTIGEFYTAKGKRVNTVGITPDIIVENERIPVNEEEFAKIDYGKIDEAGKDGDMTLALEQRLNALGYFDNEPDTVFDEATSSAVRGLQASLGYEVTGIPGFYEYLFLNDYSYDFDVLVDRQLEAAVGYLEK